MNTTDLLAKLQEIGLPADIISMISDKIASGTDILGQIQEFGLEGMLTNLGVDISSLTNVDFGAFGSVAEVFGQDIDGDGMTGTAEIADTLTDNISSSINENLGESA